MTRLAKQILKQKPPEKMRVKSYRLSEEQIKNVKREAKRLRTSESAIVRAAIDLEMGEK